MDFASYGLVLAVHSTLRWVALLAGVVAVAASWAGRAGSRSWIDTITSAGRLFALVLDVQLVVGLVLYTVLSPAIAAGRSSLSAALDDGPQRFWMFEHPIAMVGALVLAHVGVTRSRHRPGSDAHRQASWYFTIAFLLVLAALPWPFAEYGRPFLPSW